MRQHSKKSVIGRTAHAEHIHSILRTSGAENAMITRSTLRMSGAEIVHVRARRTLRRSGAEILQTSGAENAMR